MLKEFREQANLTQSQLATVADVSQQLISHVETERRSASELGLERARAIIGALNRAGVDCTLDDVFPPARSEAAQMTLDQAISHFGSTAKLAEALEIRPAAIYQWDGIPLLRQYQIERLTNGVLVADAKQKTAA